MATSARQSEQTIIRMDATLKEAIASGAKSLGTSQNAFMVEALRRHVEAVTAGQQDAFMAPLITEVLTGTIRVQSGSQRKMLVRLAYEVLRLQYVLCEFIVQAGISPGQIETWRNDGWAWAVKSFKQQPAVEADQTT